MAEKKQKPKRTWPTKSDVRGYMNDGWVKHPNKPGWEINITDMTEREIEKPKKKK